MMDAEQAPEGAQTHNQVRSDQLGNALQAGQLHGEANVGNTTFNSSNTLSLPGVSVVIGVALTLVVGFAAWMFFDGKDSPVTKSTGDRPSRELRLQSKTGVDLDRSEAEPERVDGVEGETDLYMNEAGIMYANGSGFAEDRGPDQQARARCTEAVAKGQNTAIQMLPVTGMQYCFATSDGRIGWLRVKSTSSLAADSSVVLTVQTWQG